MERVATEQQPGTQTEETSRQSAMGREGRLVSLDAFRGATIASMILVNNPGSWKYIYPQLAHASWHGWTFTDWIFPFFLYIVGVALTLSFAKRVAAGDNKTRLFVHVVRRSVIIFALGLFLAGFPFGLAWGHHFSLETIRIPGVLQRIAICYLVASAIFLTSGLRGQIIWTVSLLALYWIALMVVPVPGYGAGVLDPTGSLPWYIDSNLLAGHTWRGAPVPGFDPEGILSTLPAIATTLFGVLTGHWLRTQRSMEEKTGWMFVAGNAFLLIGAILDIWLPINKNLWTSSYSIFMAGWALVCFAMFYWLIDVKGYKKWATPLVIYGMNAITVFVLSGIVGRMLGLITVTESDGTQLPLQPFIFRHFYLPLAEPLNASLLFAISFILVMFLVVWILWRQKWFLKV
jgi:predicted acyltransferase